MSGRRITAVDPYAGTTDAGSLTAYNIGGTWVPFHKLHGRPAAVMPLVVLR
jgi:hypothetical protein